MYTSVVWGWMLEMNILNGNLVALMSMKNIITVKCDFTDNFVTGNTTSCCRLAVQVANKTQVLLSCSDLCYYSTHLIWDPFLLVPSLVLQGRKVH